MAILILGEADYAVNFDLTSIATLVDADTLEHMLSESEYDPVCAHFLVDGFRNGFDLGYRGPIKRRSTAQNLPFRVGSPIEMWNKIIKEVKLGRCAGPYDQIPFDYYMQSPIGLVPKAGGTQTRLIFHLSYDFGDDNDQKSFNFHTPKELCSVNYNDLDCAVKYSLELRVLRPHSSLFYGKTDMASAFRLLPGRPDMYSLLVFRWFKFTLKPPIVVAIGNL